MSITTDDETRTFDRLQEQYGFFYTPRFTVAVGGTEFTETDGVVSDLGVDLGLGAATTFSFTLTHPYDHERGRFDGLDWDLFAPGQGVSIRMGYGDAAQSPLCLGTISAVRPTFPSGGSPTVSVSGFGLLHQLTKEPEPEADRESWTHTWSDTPPHEVVKRVVAERGYPFDRVETVAAGVTPPEIKQDEADHDLAFLLSLAETYAYELYEREAVLYFQPPRYDGPADVLLSYGTSLESFTPEVNTAGQLDRVEVRHWDPVAGTELVGSATRGEFVEEEGTEPATEVLRLLVRTVEEATERARAILARRLDGTVTGSGECIGLPEIRPGTRIALGGLTERFTATYYVRSATHRFTGSGYRTAFEVKRREL